MSALPGPIVRLLRFAGQTMRTARNPCLTAREAIEVGNWLLARTWQPISTAPRDRPILGWCEHGADPYWEEEGKRLTVYGAHAEGLSHVQDGPHVLVWGGSYDDGDWESGYSGSTFVPDWWFLAGSDFEVAANPTHWCEVPPDPT